MLSIESFWNHINDIEQQLDRNTNFPPYNIVRHDEENATIEFAVAGTRKMILRLLFIPILKTIRFWKLLLIVNLPRRKHHMSIEESLAASSALDSLTEDWDITGAYCEDGILSVNVRDLSLSIRSPKPLRSTNHIPF